MRRLLLSLLIASPAFGAADLVVTQQGELAIAGFSRNTAVTVANDTAETGSTNQIINSTGHQARVGDLLRFTDAGPNFMVEVHVSSVLANSITLTRTLPVAPSSGDNFSILRLITPQITSSGAVVISGGSPPIVPTGSNQALGTLDCTALTGTYAPIVTPAFVSCLMVVFNSCDKSLFLSIDSGTTDAFKLAPGDNLSLDLCTNGRSIGSGVAIEAKHDGVVPAAGTLRISTAG